MKISLKTLKNLKLMDMAIATVILILSYYYTIQTGNKTYAILGVSYILFSVVGWNLFQKSKSYDIISKDEEYSLSEDEDDEYYDELDYENDAWS